jgi:hypothetical protein
MRIYDINGNAIPISAFISVKDYGAIGDGTADDAQAIQSALNALRDSGGIIYFPVGTYKVSTAVLFYSNQTLWFENGATLMQSAEIDNILRSYCKTDYTGYTGTHDCLIYGATFDGGAFTTNNTLAAVGHTKNIIFENCIFKNAYGTYHNLEINSSYNVKVINCDFEGSRKNGQNAELIQIDGSLSGIVYPWTGFNVDHTVSKYIDIDGCIFHDDTISPAIGNHADAAHDFIKIHNCIFDGFTSGRGAIEFTSSVQNVDIYGNTFNGCTKGIGSSGATYYIHDNRFVGATTAISGSASVAHANMINGTYTA